MKTHIMTDMDQQIVLCPYPTGKGYRVVDQLMGVMGLGEAKGIHHQQFGSFHICIFLLGNRLHVGNIGQGTDTITQDGQFAVHHLNRHDVQVADTEGFMFVDLMQSDGRHSRITVLCKTVRQHLEHTLSGNRISIDIDLAKLTIRTDIIHATYMVVMAVGYQDTVDPAKGFGKDLLTEIRTAVDEQARLFRLYQHGTASPFVLRIGALAYLTLAADDRHATRCPGS